MSSRYASNAGHDLLSEIRTVATGAPTHYTKGAGSGLVPREKLVTSSLPNRSGSSQERTTDPRTGQGLPPENNSAPGSEHGKPTEVTTGSVPGDNFDS